MRCTCPHRHEVTRTAQPCRVDDVPVERGSLDQFFVIDPRPIARRSNLSIHQAQNRESGEVEMLKIYDTRTKDAYREEKIREEASIGFRIAPHPAVMHSRCLYDTGDTLTIALGYCSGGTLFDRIIREGPLREDQAAGIIVQVLTGLAHIHRQGIIHRDVKPENIFIFSADSATEGGPMSIKVCIGDFSAATQKNPNGVYAGSPQYSAPELALIALHRNMGKLGNPLYNEKCDMWSVGVMTFVVLTGLLPFDGEATEDVFLDVVKNTIPFAKAPMMSKEAKSFILSLTATNPGGRPSAADALRHPWLIPRRHY